MGYKLLAGAPFDPGNIFYVPAVDAGLIVNPYPNILLDNIDGGLLGDGAGILVDGGQIPLAGTASYDPNITYGPENIVSGGEDVPGNEGDPTPVVQPIEYWILNYFPRVYRDGYILNENPLRTVDGSIPPPIGDGT